jgi:hypothetical protein
VQLWSLLYAERTEMNKALDAGRLGRSDDCGGAHRVDALKVGAIVPVAWQGDQVHHCIAANHRRVKRGAIVDMTNARFKFSWGGGYTRQ